MTITNVTDTTIEITEDDGGMALRYGSTFAANKVHRTWDKRSDSPPFCNTRTLNRSRKVVGKVPRTQLCKNCFSEHAK